MTSDYGDAVAAALHAEAEQAREEIRAAGIACPSCGKNTADVYGGHRYENVGEAGIPLAVKTMTGTVKCSDGVPVPASGMVYEQWVAAANISLMDEVWRGTDEAMTAEFTGTDPGRFTGFLDALRDG